MVIPRLGFAGFIVARRLTTGTANPPRCIVVVVGTMSILWRLVSLMLVMLDHLHAAVPTMVVIEALNVASASVVIEFVDRFSRGHIGGSTWFSDGIMLLFVKNASLCMFVHAYAGKGHTSRSAAIPTRPPLSPSRHRRLFTRMCAGTRCPVGPSKRVEGGRLFRKRWAELNLKTGEIGLPPNVAGIGERRFWPRLLSIRPLIRAGASTPQITLPLRPEGTPAD